MHHTCGTVLVARRVRRFDDPPLDEMVPHCSTCHVDVPVEDLA